MNDLAPARKQSKQNITERIRRYLSRFSIEPHESARMVASLKILGQDGDEDNGKPRLLLISEQP